MFALLWRSLGLLSREPRGALRPNTVAAVLDGMLVCKAVAAVAISATAAAGGLTLVLAAGLMFTAWFMRERDGQVTAAQAV